jgi:hypothetical protein
MTLDCYIAHQITGRTRLKPLSCFDEPRQLAQAGAAIAAIKGVERITPRDVTGSLIIEHPSLNWAELQSRLELAGITVNEAPVKQRAHALTSVVELMQNLDGDIQELTHGGADSRSLIFSGLLVMALVQFMRGNIAAPAISLLLYASKILHEIGHDRPPD